MGVLGALLGGRRVSHGALGLRGTLDVALVAEAGPRVLTGRQKTHEVSLGLNVAFQPGLIQSSAQIIHTEFFRDVK